MVVAEVLTFIPLHIPPFNEIKLFDYELTAFKYHKISSFNAQTFKIIISLF